MPERIPVQIQTLVHEGYGLSRLPNGRVVFVPFTMPGETIEAKIIREKKNLAYAEPGDITAPHTSRTQPRCQHFGLCGGCHFQHIPYELQLQYKQQVFQETLLRIGGIRNSAAVKAVPSPDIWNYRNTMQFRLMPPGKLSFADWMNNGLFPVNECLLPMPLIDRAWQQIDFNNCAIERVEFRQNQEEDLMIIFHGRADDLPVLETETTASIVHLDGHDQVVLAGEGYLLMRVCDFDFRVSAGSFFQTNFQITSALKKYVTELAMKYESRNVMDLYCGVGLFSAFLADKVEHITAVESSPIACEDFAVNLDSFDNLALYQGRVEQVLPFLDTKPDCVIVDPPRAGLHKRAAETLMKLSAPVIIYVSCNPATLARDAKIFTQSGYMLESTILLDMFPQTYHTESVNLFFKA